MKEEMKELYTEGLASHGGPESCVGGRKGVSEALTGVRVGRLLSREITEDRGADTVVDVEGNTASGASASRERAPRGLRTLHARNLHAREPGDPVRARRPRSGAAGRSGKAEATSLRCTRTGSQTAPYYRRSRRTRQVPRRRWREGG